MFGKVLKKIFWVVEAVVAIFVFFILVVLASPLYLYRLILSKVGTVFKCGFSKILPTHSNLFAVKNIEEAPSLNVLIGLEVEGPMNQELFIQTIRDKMVFLKNSEGHLVYPEFQQYFVNWMGYGFWKWESEFNILEHIRVLQFQEEIPKSSEEVFQKGMELIGVGCKREKSPWEFCLVEMQNSYVILFKFHHSLADGYSIFHALTSLCDCPTTLVKPNSAVKLPLKKRLTNLVFSFKSVIVMIHNLVIGEYKENGSRSSWEIHPSKMSSTRNYSLTPKIPVENIKELSKKLNVSVNSVVLSGVSEGIRRYLEEAGETIPKYFGCNLPVGVPGHPPGLVNSLAFANFELPIQKSSHFDRSKDVEVAMQAEKDSLSFQMTYVLCTLVGGLPTFLRNINPIQFQPISTSIFPAPRYCITLNGQSVVDMYYAINSSGIYPCILSICSYNNNFRITSSFDKNVCSQQKLAEEFSSAMHEELLKNTTDIRQGDKSFIEQNKNKMVAIEIGP